MESHYRCVCCGSSRLEDGPADIACADCGHRFPVRFGVPLFLPEVSWKPSGFRLDDELALAICRYAGIDTCPENLDLAYIRHWCDQHGTRELFEELLAGVQ